MDGGNGGEMEGDRDEEGEMGKYRWDGEREVESKKGGGGEGSGGRHKV